MFIDQARITVKAGDGSSGIVSFHKDKLHPKGIPDGGSGGNGGSIIFEVDEGLNTLQQYKYQPYFKGKNGARGGSNRKNGKNGEDMTLTLPPGTVIKDKDGNTLFDITRKGQKFIAARGGIGGHGNAFFTSASYKAPKFAQKGEVSDPVKLQLELKVLADVGIVGFPNVGKSTLISVISKAKPKIADYPFTTVIPNLGVVETREGYSYVVADIPGLIEGAHKGKGLGDVFLRHVERAGIILYLLDASAKDPLQSYKTLKEELILYSQELAQKIQVIALNKIDLLENNSLIKQLEKHFKNKDLPFFAISALEKEGINPLVEFLGGEIRGLTKPLPVKEEVVYRLPKKEKLSDYRIEKEDGVYRVKGCVIERVVKMTDFDNEEAVDYLHRQFKKASLDEKLAKIGAKEGDIVEIAGAQFDFKEELATSS